MAVTKSPKGTSELQERSNLFGVSVLSLWGHWFCDWKMYVEQQGGRSLGQKRRWEEAPGTRCNFQSDLLLLAWPHLLGFSAPPQMVPLAGDQAFKHYPSHKPGVCLWFGILSHVFLGWTWTFSVAEDDQRLLVLLLAPPRCWDYRPVPPFPAHMVLGIKA